MTCFSDENKHPKIFLIKYAITDDAHEESLYKVTQVFVNPKGEVTVVVAGGFRQLVEFGIAMASQCSYSPDSSTATILHEKTDNILGGG